MKNLFFSKYFIFKINNIKIDYYFKIININGYVHKPYFQIKI